MRLLAHAAIAVLLVAMSAPAHATPRRFIIEPPGVVLAVRGYGLGLLAIDGHFTRFHGSLTLDDQDPAACALSLEADSDSIALPSNTMVAIARGPEVLDVSRYPQFAITGRCADGKLRATLLLHGISKPLSLAVSARPGEWTAAGLLRRAEWGMDARPWLAGPEVRLSITAELPTGFNMHS